MKLKIVLARDCLTGNYIAEVRSIPGCIAEGRTKKEAVSNLKPLITNYRMKQAAMVKIHTWQGAWHKDDDFAVWEYLPSRYGGNTYSNYILDFKQNRSSAIKLATEKIIELVSDIEPHLRDIYCKYLVVIPSSTAGCVNPASEQICNAIAENFNWLTFLPTALERIETVQKSAHARYGQRPTYHTHLQTIRYNSPISVTGNFLMFDDVITLSATSRACRTLITQATKCNRVIGIYLGKTVRPT